VLNAPGADTHLSIGFSGGGPHALACAAAHIPGARVDLGPGAGHLTMTVTAIEAILDDLLDLAAPR